MGSQLVTIHNQEENVYVQHRHNGERAWIGLNDRSVEGSFVWTNKEISKFRFWAHQQPNDWNNEDCVHTLGAKHGYAWNDVPCDNCFNFTCFTGTSSDASRFLGGNSHTIILLFSRGTLKKKQTKTNKNKQKKIYIYIQKGLTS